MTRIRIAGAALILALAFTGVQPPAHAAGLAPRGRARSDESPGERAARHFAAKEWDAAIEALIEAHALDPDPDYLYARAQAERFRGRCDAALIYYQRFLASDPQPRQRADTVRNIELCELQQREAGVPPPRVDPEPRNDAQASALPPPAAPQDVAGAVLVTLGAISTAAGASVWIAGARLRARAPESAHEASYVRTASRGRTLTGVGIGITSVGVATLLAGIVRYAVLVRRARARSR